MFRSCVDPRGSPHAPSPAPEQAPGGRTRAPGFAARRPGRPEPFTDPPLFPGATATESRGPQNTPVTGRPTTSGRARCVHGTRSGARCACDSAPGVAPARRAGGQRPPVNAGAEAVRPTHRSRVVDRGAGWPVVRARRAGITPQAIARTDRGPGSSRRGPAGPRPPCPTKPPSPSSRAGSGRLEPRSSGMVPESGTLGALCPTSAAG